MKRMSYGVLVALALGAGPVMAQQAQASAGVSTGRAAVCRDSKGAAYSTGALLKAADGSIDRCEDGEWLPAPESATGGPQQGRGQGVQAPQPTPPGQRGQGQQQPQSARRPQGEPANVRLEIEINDQSAGGKPVKKMISMLIADRWDGRVRSTGTLTQEWVNPGMVAPDGKPVVNLRPVGEVQLNVDASVELLDNDRIRSRITVEYTPGPSDPIPAGSAVTRSPLNQSVTVILHNGKPLVITQAADPLSDRKITVEVTATILR